MTDRAEIGERVHSARKALFLSQQEVADATGIPRTALSDVENGRRNLFATELPALAGVLQRSVGWIVGVEKDPAPQMLTELGFLEDRCDSCGGIGERVYVLEQYDATRLCDACGGRGEYPSQAGHELLMFLKRYGMRVPHLDWQDEIDSDGAPFATDAEGPF